MSLLEEEDEFTSFRASGCGARSPFKRISQIRFDVNGDQINIYFEGSGFLKYMVRNIIGN